MNCNESLYCLNDKPDAPVIGFCKLYCDKLVKARGKIKDSRVFIGKDLSKLVR